MSAPYALYNRPRNPDFGSGVYRRRVRLLGQPGLVLAEMEDCNHGFRCRLYHDGSRITAIEPEALRTPLTTCVGALQPIQAMVGTPLDIDSRQLARAMNPRSQCTHLYDLAALAIHHGLRGCPERIFDVAIPDEDGIPTLATVTLNGTLLLSWTISEWVIKNEGPLHGRSLGKGFSKWASEFYQGDERDGAFILQKGYFVSNARRYDINQLEGEAVTEVSGIACYSYSPGIIETAVRTADSTRDFTDTPEQLLQFL